MKKKIKWFAAGVGILLLLSIISSSESDKKIKSETSTSPESQEVPQAQPELTDKQLIENTITQLLSGQNNRKVNNLGNTNITEIKDGIFKVEVEFNANDNFGNDLIKSGIEKQMSEIYQALFTGYKTVGEVSVGAKFPMVNEYGDESDVVVYHTTLIKDEADKVNWEADDSTLKLTILPSVWQTDILHSEFK